MSEHEIREMMYFGHPMRHILAEGAVDGYHYVVLTLGTHPAAYVQIPSVSHALDISAIPCHGGVTYCDRKLQVSSFEVRDGFWIGWDYAHIGDYSGYYPSDHEHKWKTEEMIAECLEVIAYLKTIIRSSEVSEA